MTNPNDVFLVPQPSNDVNDPLRWPPWKKQAAFFNVALMPFMLVGTNGGLAPALYQLGPELGATQTQLIGLVTFVTLIVELVVRLGDSGFSNSCGFLLPCCTAGDQSSSCHPSYSLLAL